MLPSNPNYDKPYKSYARFGIFGAGISVIATIARVRNTVTILWPETEKPLTDKQAVEYVNALMKAIRWGAAGSGHPTGWANKPGKQVETDNLTFSRRLLFHDDDSAFVEIRRSKLNFGLFTRPKVTIDGGMGDMAAASQVINSINAAFDDTKAWGK